MPIIEFENRDEAPLVLVIDPFEHRHEVPHLARAGIRYSVADGEEDRCYSAVWAHRIQLWCEDESYEIDIVPASPAEKLLWDICVNGGWCGATVEGVPRHVTDLLPKSGKVTAESFAKLAVHADGWPPSEPPKERDLRWLESKFVEHLGSASVEAHVLHRPSRSPFAPERA